MYNLAFMKSFMPFQFSFAFHIETSNFICIANQVNGFYVNCNTELKWLQPFHTNIPLCFTAF